MIVFPNAKINLGLNIVSKREDGFHNIETVFYPVFDLYEGLELILEEGFGKISLKTWGMNISPNEKNIVEKAYELLLQSYQLPSLRVFLQKNIPSGAGLGGGSADAVFFIKAINQLANLGLSFGEIHHYARQLGSDCSFFVNNKPAFAIGKGDELEHIKLDLSGYYILLVFPGIFVSTAQAYAGVKPRKPEHKLEKDILKSPLFWKDLVTNQFEETVFKLYPELSEIKNTLYQNGSVYASMSGSGSTIFGIFEEKPENIFSGKYQIKIAKL